MAVHEEHVGLHATADLQETIVALSTAHGPGARAIVRLTGERALPVALQLFHSDQKLDLHQRGLFRGELRLAGLAAVLPCQLYFWPAPQTFTGQDLVELHTISCPPLLEWMVTQLLNAGARAAQPGEFTLRAFLGGKLDLPRAEAVRGVIEAGSRGELKQALGQLAGGITRPLHELREDLLNLLADVEAALDFAEEDIQFVEQKELLLRLARALALVTLAQKQVQERGISAGAYRVVLAGRPNAGKSSLFNALAGATMALVSSEPGTTRDYLTRRLDIDGVAVELVDIAGWQDATTPIEERAQHAGRGTLAGADLVLWCQESGPEPDPLHLPLCLIPGLAPVLKIATKCDLHAAGPNLLATSVVTGEGMQKLRATLADSFRSRKELALAPSLSRCRHHVEACLKHLRLCHGVVLNEDPPEILALELRGAITQLGEMVGAVYTEELLDRIFSRFCIGK
jgi:tRNA modification GTPase